MFANGAVFEWNFGVVKVILSLSFQRVSDLRVKTVVVVLHYRWSNSCYGNFDDQTGSIKENMLREEGFAEFDPASVSGSESLSKRQCWDERTEYIEGVGGNGCGGAQQAQDAVEERVCGNYIFVRLMFLCVWFCSGSLAAILNIVKMVRNAWNERVNRKQHVLLPQTPSQRLLL